MDFDNEYCMDCAFYITGKCTKRRMRPYIDHDDLDWCEDFEKEIREGRSIE